MTTNYRRLSARLMCATSAVAIMALASGAHAEVRQYDIPSQSLGEALARFGAQSDVSVVTTTEITRLKSSQAVSGAIEPEMALAQLLGGTGLSFRREGDTFLIVRADADPQGGSAAGDGAGTVEALIVTAQKREEDIQDVPIAISAFTQENLERSQIAGGPDLITQVPNMSFTKTNFSSYSVQIRGIGTQAISATTDPAVAVAFNNTPFIRNRFFEQEFYDLERLEVLRGPQGTLYGRNATAGVVNIISQKPKFSFESKLSADVSNYSSSRLEGMINLPLVEDKVALRLAGAWTKREGYATNQFTGKQIDGRDLWSARATLRFEPTDWISANLIYEHFDENDDRLRSGKQLCKKDVVEEIGGVPVTANNQNEVYGTRTYLGQGCLPTSMYSVEAFQTPNGYTLPFYGPTSDLGGPVYSDKDPYVSSVQSRDLRVIESTVEPEYQAKTDIGELHISIDLTPALTLTSETAYNEDSVWSMQDYNRFTTATGAFRPNQAGVTDENGFFCDPQLGCSDRLLLVDLSTSESTQFSQEFRLGSDYDGPFNFSLGANFLRQDSEDKYYVFVNSLSAFAIRASGPDPFLLGQTGDTAKYYDPTLEYGLESYFYVDPNPIGSLNDQGRNYFLSRNPYKLISYAVFGEAYYNVTDNLKITGGLRWTVDEKTAPQIPSWLLAQETAGPYPVAKTIVQEWREPTGRLAIDWKPDLSFTDETLLYASYAHGYKAGGANPPPPVFVAYGTSAVAREFIPDVFGPEFVNAVEVGSKNTLLDGRMTLNMDAFYYDYTGYQVSEIRNRSAVNSNYDAEVWGAELEIDWRPLENLKLGFKGGYNGSRIADGEKAIDLMDRTAGMPGWLVIRPFPTVPSNCILPESVLLANGTPQIIEVFPGPCVQAYYQNLDPVTRLPYDPTITDYSLAPTSSGGVLGPQFANYHGFDPSTAPNNGKGFDKQLGGNQLPNAPEFTATVTVDYTLPLPSDWLATLHGDYHYQGQSWGRVFNDDPYDRINDFSIINLAAIFTNDEAGWKVMAYIKNVLDNDAITGTFLNSDDTGLTTNVFLTEPRLYGVRVTKNWAGGGAWWAGLTGPGAGPFPLTVEIGGGVSRFEADNEDYHPAWMDNYSDDFPIPDVQNDDLDWNGDKEVTLTYRPGAGPWKISAGYRFGRTNGSELLKAYETVAGGTAYFFGQGIYFPSPDNHLRGSVHDQEEFGLVDFTVGREVGLGALSRSSFGIGVRYAEFESGSRVLLDGVPNRYVPTAWNLYPTTPPQPERSHYNTSLTSDREFEGYGPQLSWDASVRLWGEDAAGHADLDWTISGGALFGQQKSVSVEDQVGIHYTGGIPDETANDVVNDFFLKYEDIFADRFVTRTRKSDATVPTLGVSLGLSYEVQRVKVSTGYRYDRFFDVLDAGYKESRSYDRTIQGPYFKLSVGFGG